MSNCHDCVIARSQAAQRSLADRTLNAVLSACSGLLLLLFGLLLPAAAGSAEFESYPADNPAFSLPDQNDVMHTLADYRGKVVLVNFWASWCPPCIYEMPELTQLKNQLDEQPFEILAINVGEKKYRVRKFTQVTNFRLPVLLDTSSKVFDDWGVETLPTSYLVDADGRMRYRVRGNPGWVKEDTLKLVSKLITDTVKADTAAP